MALSLRRNAVWAILGHGVFAACHWGGLVVLGRLGGPEELGRYALALAVATPILLFAGLQMRQLQAADATHRYRFEDYFAVRLAGMACAGVVLVAVALVGYAGPVALAILLAGLAKALEGLSDVHYGLAQRHKRLDLVTRSLILRGVLGLLALAVAFYVSRDLLVGLAAMAAVWGCVWWFFDRAATMPWRTAPPDPVAGWRSNLGRRLGLAQTALPLGGAMLLVTLNPNVPRYFLEAMVGLGALGLFTAMAHFVVAGRMPVNALCEAAFPRLADLYAAGDLGAVRRLLVRLMVASALPALAGLIVAVTFGRELLRVIYGPEFAAAADAFPWVMLVGVVLYAQTPFGYGLTAMHQIKIQPLLFALPVVVNAAACLLLVPRYGMMGATFAWLAAAACSLLLSVAACTRCLARGADATATTPAGSVRP